VTTAPAAGCAGASGASTRTVDEAPRGRRLGTARTTDDGDRAPVEGVVDTGGRVFYPVSASVGLGEGRAAFASSSPATSPPPRPSSKSSSRARR
jgi:hypothetical protein